MADRKCKLCGAPARQTWTRCWQDGDDALPRKSWTCDECGINYVPGISILIGAPNG